MNILPGAATLGLSADEFLPLNPCLSLWSSEGIVFVYSQPFFHQEHSRQCGEKRESGRGREEERDGKIRSYLRNGAKMKNYYANFSG